MAVLCQRLISPRVSRLVVISALGIDPGRMTDKPEVNLAPKSCRSIEFTSPRTLPLASFRVPSIQE
jgi:hypothetical protein